MDKESFKQKLKEENFPIVYEWHDEPGTIYPEHSHQGHVTFFVVYGSVTFSGGINQVVSAGERIDVPVGVKHSALVSPDGCDYIIGQDIEGDA